MRIPVLWGEKSRARGEERARGAEEKRAEGEKGREDKGTGSEQTMQRDREPEKWRGKRRKTSREKVK